MTRSLNPDFPAGPAFNPRIDLPTADRVMSLFTFAISLFLQHIAQQAGARFEHHLNYLPEREFRFNTLGMVVRLRSLHNSIHHS